MANEIEPKSVLVIEDEADFRDLLVFRLKEAGFAPHAFGSAKEGLAAAERTKPAVVVLDLMLPDMPGTDVCRILRADPVLRTTSILMLTAKGDEVDRIVGLELGADDYVVKPCSIRELMLRVRTLAQRTEERRLAEAAKGSEKTLKLGGIELDPIAHRVTCDRQEIPLTRIEFKLLLLFMTNPGRAFSRDRLLDEVWNITAEVTTRTVDTHIKRLREKLGAYGDSIETIRGVGYRLRA
jgi:two-component system, OmpR family, phosphate regulon response regulator PhoB